MSILDGRKPRNTPMPDTIGILVMPLKRRQAPYALYGRVEISEDRQTYYVDKLPIPANEAVPIKDSAADAGRAKHKNP